MNKKKQNVRLFTLFVVPALFIWLTVIFIPFIYGVVITFTDWDGMSLEYSFIGIENYRRIFSDQSFLTALSKTFVYSVSTVILSNILGIGIALALTSGIRGQGLFRTGFFTPNIIGGIILGYIWQFIFSFVMTSLGQQSGISALEKSWLTDPDKALLALIIVTTWQMSGYLMVIYVAGLTNVPGELLEAAEIDGAGIWQQIRLIKMPLIRNSITICIFLTVTRTFMAFDINLSLTSGGPYKSTELIAYKIYQSAFANMKFGLGQSQAIVLFVIVAVVSLIQVYISGKGEQDQ